MGMFLESCFHCRNLARIACQECGGVAKPFADSHRRKQEMWCCNCAGKGHLIDECRRYFYSKYPPPELRVQSYSEPPVLDQSQGTGRSRHGPEDRQDYVASAAALQFIKSDPRGGGKVDRRKVKKDEKK